MCIRDRYQNIYIPKASSILVRTEIYHDAYWTDHDSLSGLLLQRLPSLCPAKYTNRQPEHQRPTQCCRKTVTRSKMHGMHTCLASTHVMRYYRVYHAVANDLSQSLSLCAATDVANYLTTEHPSFVDRPILPVSLCSSCSHNHPFIGLGLISPNPNPNHDCRL